MCQVASKRPDPLDLPSVPNVARRAHCRSAMRVRRANKKRDLASQVAQRRQLHQVSWLQGYLIIWTTSYEFQDFAHQIEPCIGAQHKEEHGL